MNARFNDNLVLVLEEIGHAGIRLVDDRQLRRLLGAGKTSGNRINLEQRLCPSRSCFVATPASLTSISPSLERRRRNALGLATGSRGVAQQAAAAATQAPGQPFEHDMESTGMPSQPMITSHQH
jgi:hypothetical protein